MSKSEKKQVIITLVVLFLVIAIATGYLTYLSNKTASADVISGTNRSYVSRELSVGAVPVPTPTEITGYSYNQGWQLYYVISFNYDDNGVTNNRVQFTYKYNNVISGAKSFTDGGPTGVALYITGSGMFNYLTLNYQLGYINNNASGKLLGCNVTYNTSATSRVNSQVRYRTILGGVAVDEYYYTYTRYTYVFENGSIIYDIPFFPFLTDYSGYTSYSVSYVNDLSDNEIAQIAYNNGYTQATNDITNNVDIYGNEGNVTYESIFESGRLEVKNNNADPYRREVYNIGYNVGKADGIVIGSERADYSFRDLLGAVVDTPVQAFMQIFDFEIWGINISSFIAVLFTLCIVLIILKVALGRK